MPKGGARPGTGPKPAPVEQKLREGTYRPDRDGPAEGVRPPDNVRPKMPVGLSARAKRAWHVVLDDLEASALLDSADAPLYEAFAVNLARAREARVQVERHGVLVRNRFEELVRNPAIAVERDALREVRMLAESLAIGMSARARLGMSIARGTRTAGDRPAAETDPTGIGPSPRSLSVVRGGRGD